MQCRSMRVVDGENVENSPAVRLIRQAPVAARNDKQPQSSNCAPTI